MTQIKEEKMLQNQQENEQLNPPPSPSIITSADAEEEAFSKTIITEQETQQDELKQNQQDNYLHANDFSQHHNEHQHHQHNHNQVYYNTASSLSTISENNSEEIVDHYYEQNNVATDLNQVLDCFNENVLPTLIITERHIHSDLKNRASLEKPDHGHKHHRQPSTEQLKKEIEEMGSSNKENQQELKLSNRRRYVNLILFLFGTMFFKFSYETLSGAIGLTILTRLEGHPMGATTILSLLTITFGLSQSISSSAVEGLLKVIRATRLYCISLLFFSTLIITMIVLEATTGGTLTSPGYWTPWIIFPIYVFIGFNVGIIEVVRKIIPASILGNTESSTLKRLNAGIHISYEIAGTVGAFLSSVFIDQLGTIYALFHMPVCFFIGSLFFFFITLKDTERILEEDSNEDDIFKESVPTESRIINMFKKIGKVIKDYFYSMYMGAKIVLTNRYYIWLIPCFVIPQVLHRLIENIFLPAFSKMILKKGSYSGIMLGGSNFGELVGAGLLLIFAKRVKLPTVWIILDSLFLNLMWIFPFLTFDETTNHNLIFAICIVPAMVLISGSWAAGDISQIAYLQSTLSDEPNEKTGVNELAAVMSFLYSCYIVLTTLVAFGLSQAVDRFKESGKPEFGFMTICIVMSVISFAICIIYLTVAKFKPSAHDDHLGEEHEMQTNTSTNNVERESSIEHQTVNV